MKRDHAWTFHSPLAELRAGALTGHIDTLHPELGIHRLAVHGDSIRESILGVHSRCQSPPMLTDVGDLQRDPSHPWHQADAYLRGDDLVATYQSTATWPYSTQLYWTVDPSASSTSLLVSLQTHLLDTWPTVSIETRLVADELLWLAYESGTQTTVEPVGFGNHAKSPTATACCLLYRLSGVPMSYAEIMPANEAREITVMRPRAGACHVRWKLFAEFLEKGVIRRARLQSIVVPRANDIQEATSVCGEIKRRPLPLTT